MKVSISNKLGLALKKLADASGKPIDKIAEAAITADLLGSADISFEDHTGHADSALSATVKALLDQ